MIMGDDDVLEVIDQAERVVWAASWRLQEEIVLGQLAGGQAQARQVASFGSAAAAAAALALACGKMTDETS
jgi:hypothetical protein